MRREPSSSSVASAKNRIITLTDREFGGNVLPRMACSNTSGAWHTANKPVLVPVTLSRGAVVQQFVWLNGTSAGGGVDVGLYDLSFNRIVSVGGATGLGNSVWQFADVTDTPVAAGRYYLAYVRDNTTANRASFLTNLANANVLALVGIVGSSDDSYPLPNPIASIVATTLTLMPQVGIVCRSYS